MNGVGKPMEDKMCCEKFKIAVEFGDIYAGILAPNVPTWMSKVDRMLANNILSSHVNFAGADGVAWDDCPFCGKELKSPTRKQVTEKEKASQIRIVN